MKRLNLTKASLSFINQLPGQQYKQIVSAVFDLLSNPVPQDARPVKGYPCLRIDVGEYRTVYETTDSDLFIQLVGKRNDDEIYRRLARQR